MPLKTIGTIAIPHAAGSAFDHGAYDAKSCRIFIAHTARDCVEGSTRRWENDNAMRVALAAHDEVRAAIEAHGASCPETRQCTCHPSSGVKSSRASTAPARRVVP